MARLTGKRIMDRCIMDGDCLIWTGKFHANGHPAASEYVDGKDRYVGVRRRAYEEYHKVTLSKGQVIATCENKACLSKKCLRVTTVSQRSTAVHATMDAATKLRRSKKLAQTWQAKRGKITPEQVAAIRDSADGPYVTAKRLGVSGVIASRIRNGTSYREYGSNPFAGLM